MRHYKLEEQKRNLLQQQSQVRDLKMDEISITKINIIVILVLDYDFGLKNIAKKSIGSKTLKKRIRPKNSDPDPQPQFEGMECYGPAAGLPHCLVYSTSNA